MKLCIVIVPEADGDRLLDRLTQAEFGATKVGSSGGFRRRESVTAFVSVEDERVSELLTLLHGEFPEVLESVSVSTLPLAEEWGQPTEMIDVRVGGVVVFVIDLAQVLRV
jgi:uncharacterized protein YaaQ